MNDDLKRSNSTPNPSTTPVAPATFYTTQAPALPTRQASVGSSHTTYVSPTAATPPSYSSTWREPELVPEEETAPPTLVPSQVASTSTWETEHNNPWSGYYEGGGWSDTAPAFGKAAGPAEPRIDGRSEDEEKEWWSRRGAGRPGRGMLPPLLAERLHHADHSLFMVGVTPPDIRPSSSTPPSPAHTPPTPQEVLESIPHPNAYYCRKHNGWVLLAWKSSSILPPLTATAANGCTLPDQDRRKRTHSCLDEQPFGPANKTHHFHLYEQAVDAAHLTPAFARREWERDLGRKNARRRVTITEQVLVTNQGNTQLQVEDAGRVPKGLEADEERDLLDLYVCCQCSFYVVASDVIPGVIPPKYVDEFTSDKAKNPPVGRTGEQSVVLAWEVIMTIIENKLWKGNNRSLSVSGKVFLDKVGWSLTTRKIFDALGFALSSTACEPGQAPAHTLIPPLTDPSTAEGNMNRARLLRAWVEIGAMLVDYQRRFPNSVKEGTPHKLCVKVESARESYQTAIGAHPDQLPRGGLPESLMRFNDEDRGSWEELGMTPTSYTRELLQFAYLAQCRCDPALMPEHFTALSKLVTALRNAGEAPHELETLLVEEQSRGRFSTGEIFNATRVLGFGADNALRVDFEDDVPEEFITRAWRDGVRRSWSEGEAGAGKRRDLNEAFRIVAELRGSKELWRLWDEERVSGMTPEKAYATLEVPEGVDEEMLITVYGMRVEDQPSQLDKMKDALRVIAEFTGSERLQKFLDTGSDPGIIVAPTRPDWPRGLNQLGNTCYLNSLLQYFYTIKDLREAIAPLAAASEKFMDDGKLKDDDLKNHRVGGRMVTRREVMRSRKFVSQLAALFWHLEWSETPAVTPSMDLAKLALVTSKDEEEEDHDGDRGGTDSSHSTDATLVDENASQQPPVDQPMKSASPLARSPSSVLGKRSRGTGRRRTDSINVDGVGHTVDESEKDKDGFVLVDKPVSPLQLGSPATEDDLTPRNGVLADEPDHDGDVQMDDSDRATGSAMPKAPPLPPRPKHQASTSDMMFGKQHDVAECMDNCMFQIETALLQLGELAMAGSDDESKRSVVKKLFYGKIRQRLSMQADAVKARSSMHEREDFFSHLPVNVSEESFDLYDGLSGYFDDVVEFEGKAARMEVALVELPPILQIQLQRVQFNRDTLQPYKSHAYVKFNETIRMDRFLNDAPPDKKARSKVIQAELNECRDRIQTLTQGTHAPYIESLGNTWNFLTNQECIALPEVDPALLGHLQRDMEAVNEEITHCREQVERLKEEWESVWKDENRAEYELTSVFVHRGASPSFGHYFIYQRWLPDNPDSWFKYNDSDVSIVTKEEVLADTTGSTANPYLLVFARKGSHVIHTVQRTDPMAVEQTF